MNFSIHNSFTLIDEGKVFLKDDILKHVSEFDYIFKKQNLIILLANNSITAVSVYLQALTSKTPIMLIGDEFNDEEVLKLVRIYNPSFLISPDHISYDENNLKKIGSLSNFTIFKNILCKNSKPHKDLALLLGTSGSTGSSKFVRLTFQNILSNANSIIEYLSISESAVSITTLPMNYSYGLSIINSYAIAGGKLVLTNKSIIERDFWRLFEDQSITSISGVPYTFNLLKRVGFLKKSFPSLKVITQAGGKLNKDIKEEFLNYSEKNQIQFFVMYGQTEATARISYVPPSSLPEKIDSIGIAIPGGKLEIKKNNDSLKIGEIVYTGKNVSMGYASSEKDLSLGNNNNFVLYTGDLGYEDKDGFFFITGRKSRFIKINGVRHSLDNIESVLESNFSDIEFRCYGGDDNLKVDFQSDKEVGLNISKFISKKFKIHHKLINIEKVYEIKRNMAGKKVYSDQ